MSSPRRAAWPSALALAVGLALALGGGALTMRARPASNGAELRVAADGLHTRLEQALRARARALVPRATQAAGLRELLSGLDLGADAHTFEDLFETEDWWAPFRSEFPVNGLVSGGGALAMLGPSAGDLSRAPIVVKARETGSASGIVAIGDGAFALAAARVAQGEKRGGAVVVLGLPLDRKAFQALADGTAAAFALSDGTRIIESGGPDDLRPALSQLVPRREPGVLPLAGHQAGGAWPFDGGLWLLTVMRAPAPPPPDRTGWLLVVLGAVLGMGGLVLRLVRRSGRQDPAAHLQERADAEAAGSGEYALFRTSGDARPPLMSGAPVIDAGGDVAGGPAAAARRKEDAAPIVMGRYHLIERVGEGGMAEVFIAATHGIEGFVRHFVVKRMHPHMARNREAVNQFIDEARLQSALIHSNIVPVFDFGRAGEEYFMALEYIHGRDLELIVARHIDLFGHPLSVPVAYYIMHDVLEALAYAHSMHGEDGRSLEIVHRDVAPGNILVSFRGEVKLSDFGIAKAHFRVSQTEMGLVKGNASFMSPEQARGETVDARSDLFSAGVVLYHCLTGHFMYGGNEALFKRLMRAAAGPSSEELIELDKVPPAAAAILRRALALDPKDRYQTAREFARDLAEHFTAGRAELSDIMTQLFQEPRRDPQAGREPH